MHEQIEVVYEKGVFKPLGPLPYPVEEPQHFTVPIHRPDTREARLDAACIAAAKRDADTTVSLEEVRRILAKVPGSLTDAVHAEREER